MSFYIIGTADLKNILLEHCNTIDLLKAGYDSFIVI